MSKVDCFFIVSSILPRIERLNITERRGSGQPQNRITATFIPRVDISASDAFGRVSG